jgi:site-specific DNA recombinase
VNRRTTGLLAGKFFEENGEPLYACWAKKRDRRYRYFVSRKLIRGADKTDDRGWRLPTEEIEQAVTAAARQMLSDRGALASVLKACSLAAAELKQVLDVIDRKVKTFDEIGEIEGGAVIERVELKRDGMQITLNLRALLPTDQISNGGANLRMTREVSMRMKRRGTEMRLVIPGEAIAVSRTDPALLRALAPRLQMVCRAGVRKGPSQPESSRPERVLNGIRSSSSFPIRRD